MIAKLQLLINSSAEEGDNSGCLMHLTKLFKETDESHHYQHIKLLNFEIYKQSNGTAQKETITKVAATMEDRFKALSKSQVFENPIQILDVSLWSTGENILSIYCDTEILVADHYEKLLLQNGCNTEELSTEWD